MNLLDLGIIILLALIVLRGYYRGLFQELAVLAGLVGGLLAAAHFYVPLGAQIQHLIKEPGYSRYIAFGVILVAVYWLTRVLALFLQRLLYQLYLDVFDRLLGALFALLKGGLIVGLALMIVSVAMPKAQLIRESRAAPVFVHLARQALGLLPADFKKQWEKQLRDWLKPKEKEQAGLQPPFSPMKDHRHG